MAKLFAIRFPQSKYSVTAVGVNFIAQETDGDEELIRELVCSIKREALEDLDPSNRMSDSKTLFQNNRGTINNLAQTKIRENQLIDGMILITERDV